MRLALDRQPIGQSPWLQLVLHVLDALLAGDRLLHAFARAGICPRALTAHWQITAMPHTAITLDVLQPTNVLLNRTPQLALGQNLFVEIAVDLGDIVVRQL